jgi:hypothetical protein
MSKKLFIINGLPTIPVLQENVIDVRKHNPKFKALANRKCLREAMKYAIEGRDKIIVVNNFSKSSDVEPFIKLAEEYGYDIVRKAVQNGKVVNENVILNEGIADILKYYPKIPEEKVKELVALDPTYKGGDQLGKFGKWILNIYNKGNLKEEDFYKVKDYLTTFKLNYNKMTNKDLNAYKTLPDLYTAIEPYIGQQDVSHKQEIRDIKQDAEKVFEDEEWLVIVPHSQEAACYYGKGTQWCTAATTSGNMFNYYNKQGPLYININKKTNEKYQFHFETKQYMDEKDEPIVLTDILKTDEKLTAFYKNIIIGDLNDPKRIHILTQYMEDISIDDNKITGYVKLEDLNNVYHNTYDGVDLDQIYDIVNDASDYFDWDYFYSGFSITNTSEGDWKKYIAPLNISYDTIIDIFQNDGEYSDENITEDQASSIYDYMVNDYTLEDAYANSWRNGTIDEATTDIAYDLKNNLPTDADIQDLVQGKLKIILSKDEFQKIILKRAITDPDDYYEDDNIDDFLVIWRDLHFNNLKFEIRRPHYGWDGFDDNSWNEYIKELAQKVKEIVGSPDNDPNKPNKVDDEINEVLRIAGVKQLNEGIADILKYYPKLSEEKVKELVALDPTYKGGDQLGKFGKWILNIYNRGNLKEEDFYKVKDYLTTFKLNYNKMANKDLNAYKSLPDLYTAIEPYIGQQDVSHKQEIKNIKQDAEKVFEDDNWLVIIPHTREASCYYGKNTQWCTAATTSNNMFDRYNKFGPLYININKKTNEKFQFHFETRQFMDERDKRIIFKDFIKNNPDLKEFYIKVLLKIPNIYASDLVVDFRYTKDENINRLAVQKNGKAIRFIKNPPEELQRLAIQQDGKFIRFIKNPTEAIQQLAVQNNSNYIQYIKNPTEAIQRLAVQNDGLALKFIDNPSEELQRLAVQQNPVAIQSIKNPPEKWQLSAVRRFKYAYYSIENPTEKVKKLYNKLYGKPYGKVDDEINEVLRIAGVKDLEESQVFNGYDDIKEQVINKCFNSDELRNIVQDNDISFYINSLGDDLKNQLANEYGVNDEEEMVEKIIENKDDSLPSKVYHSILSKYYDLQKNHLMEEFSKSSEIFRNITFNGELNDLLKIIQSDGTGNCWAKEEGNAESYYGDNVSTEYTLVGEVSIDNVDWLNTMYLRMVADYEDEIRLKPNSSIKLISIKQYHYNNDTNSFDKPSILNVNKTVSVGNKWVFESSNEELDEMAYPTNFSLQDFSNLKTFKDRVAYCDQRLQKLGTGSSRTAYKVDEQKVLKIAKNRKGIAQNEHECDWNRNNYGCFAEIYEADTENYTWVEMELARKATNADFKKIVGMSIEEVAEVLKYFHDVYSDNRHKFNQYGVDKGLEAFAKKLADEDYDTFFNRIRYYMSDYQPEAINDWFRLANWGVVNRNGNEELVIIDDGLDEDVYKQYYARKRW